MIRVPIPRHRDAVTVFMKEMNCMVFFIAQSSKLNNTTKHRICILLALVKHELVFEISYFILIKLSNKVIFVGLKLRSETCNFR